MLIGREKEIKKLNELYHSEDAELIALYGRRRVGKTYLIDEVFRDRLNFRHAGLSPIDSEKENVKAHLMKDQLTHFFRSLTMQGYKGKKTPESWLEAFYMLEDLLVEKYKDNERIVVFLDEMQWLDTPKAKFMTGFEAFWNGWACHRKNLMVIVCGSSSSWILTNIINNHGGLYGRVTFEIKLKPFTLRECEQFLTSKEICMSRYDVIQAYMMVGGIPYYLRYFNKRLSLAQNINEIFFADEAPLKDEFNRMFASLFKNAEPIKQIIKAIASKNKGITRKELSEITGVTDSGEVSRQLNALIAGDFIIKYKSFGDNKRDEIYKLVDPFSYFYLTFLDKSSDNRNIDWINIEDSSRVLSWKGYAFENVCWNHIHQIKMALQIGGVSTTEALWSKRGDENTRGTQIDLIIVRKDNVVHMCEIKFYNEEFEVDKDYHLILERRKKILREQIPKRATIHNTLITTYGLRKTNYFGDFVHVVTIDQLFEN
ncbi:MULTISPECIES: AAA family ATPase [Succinivibrio]|uniref:ATP-binding protein n=1 Tax=Succinivibrio faecicola TaxID=2820300 RepID=A0ABS7DER5_9GAMM|nr:ATP-binding protein [Succinivibrio faecicola]MBW7569790.1 ATP-binding protein [Succinivibrio faecicola]MCI6938551.1 ATP-binding protein [Succinatimonas hippei]